MSRARPSTKPRLRSLNANYDTVVDFAPDPVGTAMFKRISAVQGAPLSGHDGQARIGDKGAPTYTFNGDMSAPVQVFIGPGAGDINGATPPLRGIDPDLQNTLSDDPGTTSVMSIFAARHARRTIGQRG